MAKFVQNDVDYYYDSHPTREDLVGETSLHAALVHYLMEVLKWLYRGQSCAIFENLNFYQTPNVKEYPVAPDIAIIKGVIFRHVRSWRIGVYGPAPQVVFEIASEETWQKDLYEKPIKYARMGVEEYYYYDPNERPMSHKIGRLHGWQRDPVSGLMEDMPLRSDGNLWSYHLQSALVPQNEVLRLYDAQGNQRLTQAEALVRRAEIETQRAVIEAHRAEILAEKLRSLGIDPEQLL